MTRIDRWNWSVLSCLSLDGELIPGYLERLLNGDDGEQERAFGVLYCEVANQGQLYSAGAASVDVVIRHLQEGGRLPARAVSLLEAILSARDPGLSVTVDGVDRDAAQYARQRILDGVPSLMASSRTEGLEWFREFCFLVPQLSDSSPEVVDFLRHSVTDLEGERRKLCLEALEEAEEVLQEGYMP